MEYRHCTKIPNCADGTTGKKGVIYDGCTHCNENHVYGYDSARKTLRVDQCVSHTNGDNCFVKDNSLNPDSPCTFCKKGSRLVNGFCVQTSAPKCASFNENYQFDSQFDDPLIQ